MLFQKKYIAITFIQCCIAVIISLASLSQTFNYKVFTAADGLPTGTIGLIYQDSYGYLWIGSCGGLSRYDGKKFTNYELEDGLPFLCNHILLEDSAHNIWGASYNGSVAQPIKFSGGKFITVSFNKTDEVSYIFSLSQTNNGEIYASTSAGIFRLQHNNWEKILLVNNPPGKQVRNVVQLKGGSLFINSPGDYTFRVKSRRKNYAWSNEVTFAFTISPPFWET